MAEISNRYNHSTTKIDKGRDRKNHVKYNQTAPYSTDAGLVPGNYSNREVNYNILSEQGITGLTRFANFVYQDFLNELNGIRGSAIYKEMAYNDPMVGAILYGMFSLVRNVDWGVEAAGTKKQDMIAAQFVDSCRTDMDMSWSDMISDVLTFIIYGWSLTEINYKMRKGPDNKYIMNTSIGSKYNDGRIGWKGFSIRSQNTLWGWSFADDNTILGMIQLAPPEYRTRYIPMDKAMLFRTESNRNNPEGRSLLRNAYISYFYKKNIQEIEAIGIEKDLNGIPIIWLPPEIIAASSNPDADPNEVSAFNNWSKAAKNIKRNEQGALLMPLVYDEQGHKLYDITTLTNGLTRKQFDTDQIIKRHNRDIATTLLGDFITLGGNSQGSFALSSDKTNMFKLCIENFLNIICEEINRSAIPKLMRLNNFEGLTDYPRLTHGKVSEASLTELANFVSTTGNIGAINIDNDKQLEDYLREQADLTPRPDNEITPDIVLDNGESNQ